LLGIDCEQRKGAACWTLASLHSKGALPGGENGAIDLLRKGCDAQHGLSCNDLGRRSEQGRGLPQDRNSAERMFRRASELLVADCEGGQHEACGALAEILGAGKGVPRDEARAEQYRSKAAPAPSR
jgi:TPR repeat protein